MRQYLVGLVIGSAVLSSAAFAEEAKAPDLKQELVTCQQQVKTLEVVLSELGRGINKEMELAGLRLRASQPQVQVKDGNR